MGGSPAEYVQPAENSYEGGYEATRQLLSVSSSPTAIFAADDVMAIGCLAAAKDLGVGIPRDLSIVGFDDLEISAYIRPALTTVRQPIAEMGRKAVDLLLSMIEEETSADSRPQLLVGPELIVRDSSGPPRG